MSWRCQALPKGSLRPNCVNVLQAGLIPDAYIGMGNTGVGCFKPAAGLTNGK